MRRSLPAALLVLLTFGAAVSTALAPRTAAAEVPTTFSHQGRLLDNSDQPVTGQKTMTVTLYDAETDGAVLWQTEKTVEFDQHGYYAVTLGGSDNPITPKLLKGGKVWLGVAIEDGEELKPRLPLNATPYALRAARAESVAEGGVTKSALAEDFKVGWDAVEGKPKGLEDGDDDSLGNLKCPKGQIPRFNGNNWQCSADGPQTMDWTKINNVPAELADGDQDALGGINCQKGQRPQFDGMNWNCVDAPDGGDFALSGQSCGGGKVATGVDTDGKLICAADKDTDTTRSDAEIVKAVATADQYVTKKGDSKIQGNLEVTGDVTSGGTMDAKQVTADNITAKGRIRGSHLRFRRCNGKRYNCSPKACQKLCEKNDERMAFFDEVFAWASTGNNKCAHMWMLDGDVPDKVVSAYPMYYNRTSSGCGPQNTGDIPRMVARRVRSWNTSLTVDCACSTIR